MRAKWVPDTEVLVPESQERIAPGAFLLWVLNSLKEAGVTGWHAAQLAAIVILETGWGKSAAREIRVGNETLLNAAGVKLKESRVKRYRELFGRDPAWFSTAGHVAQGDPVRVQYMLYRGVTEFWSAWLDEFVGVYRGEPSGSERYREAGRLFWMGDDGWFAELLEGGYRGKQGELHPEPRIKSHQSLVRQAAKALGLPASTPP